LTLNKSQRFGTIKLKNGSVVVGIISDRILELIEKGEAVILEER